MFHLYTPQKSDAERIFAKVARRAGVDFKISSAGLRKARPGSWVRVQCEISGSLGDAIVAVLDAASKFGDRVEIVPQRLDEELTFSGWIPACSHSELAAVEFEMTDLDRG